jgi:hypothetical protein
MLDRSVLAKSASSVFFEEYNDVDVFIEDTALGYRKIFREIISRALDGVFSIEQVFPLGNREQVIEECVRNQEYTGRKRVYIIDGDLYLLNNDTPKINGLFVLPRYCIENFLIDHNAITDLVYEEDPEMSKGDFINKFNYEEWVENNESYLLELFTIYAICFKYLPQEQTIGFKVSKLVSSNSGIVCSEKVTLRINELKSKLIAKYNEIWLYEEIEKINNYLRHMENKVHKFVSAKDYLLPLLTTRIQSLAKFSCSNTNFRVRLSMKTDVSELKQIKDYFIE